MFILGKYSRFAVCSFNLYIQIFFWNLKSFQDLFFMLALVYFFSNSCYPCVESFLFSSLSCISFSSFPNLQNCLFHLLFFLQYYLLCLFVLMFFLVYFSFLKLFLSFISNSTVFLHLISKFFEFWFMFFLFFLILVQFSYHLLPHTKSQFWSVLWACLSGFCFVISEDAFLLFILF